MIVVPLVAFRIHGNERSTRLQYKPMHPIGFAPWPSRPRSLDDADRDTESFAEQAERLSRGGEM
jgi:hypothetical protein